MNAKLLDLIAESVSFRYIVGDVNTLMHPYPKTWVVGAATHLAQGTGKRAVRFRNTSQRFVANDGDTFVLQPGIARRGEWMTPPPVTVRWARVAFPIFKGTDLLSLLDIPVVITGRAGREIGEINEAYTRLTDNGKCPDLKAMAAFKRLGFRQLEILLSVSTLRPDLETVVTSFERYKDLFDYIEKNFRTPISIETLAQQASLSVSRFHRVFKQMTGAPPLAYLNQRRFREAEKLLLTECWSVGETAAHLGYPDPFTFSRSFKKHTGVSPAHFRQMER